MKQDKLSYFNTLIFTIISGIVSVALVILLFFKVGQKFKVAIIAVEVGIFAIIAYCITMIITRERRLNQIKANSNFVVNFDECGDYYVKRSDASGNYFCSNDHAIIDEKGDKYTMKIYPSENHVLPTANGINYNNGDNGMMPNARMETYKLKELDQSPVLKTTADKCAPLFVENAAFKEYSHIPWTYARARCASFNN